MKITEFRKLIREEVRKVVKEITYNLNTGEYEEDSPKNQKFSKKGLDALIQQGLQIDRDFKTQNQNKKAQETDWYELDWDFSDSDSVNFGDFEVDIDQFKKGIKDGYVIDDNGDKRSINKSIIKDILQSYKENY